MAAPSVTARGVPSGTKMPDGYQALIAFASAPTIGFWEKSIKPPAIDGGEPIDQTTMHNIKWHTMSPSHLLKMDALAITVAYDPENWDTIIALINRRDSVTVHFSSGASLSFYGFLQKWEPQELKIGEQPMANLTIIVTNYDPVNNLEVDPVLTPAVGT